jgi:hypothetical protein
MAKYPAPGRGAWRLSGGLLPGKPGGKGRSGYYRNAVGDEAPIGSAWLREEDTSHEAYCVFLGVKAIQELVDAEVDGWFGPVTAAAVLAAQKRYRVTADAIVGPASMKAFLTPLIQDLAAHNAVPAPILGGLLVNESALDPACVGVNGQDHGLAQINLGAHWQVNVNQALDPEFSVKFTVNDLSMRHAQWFGKTSADPWDIAIAGHNSPVLAKRWAKDGHPPVVPGRLFQIEEYVARARAAW